MTPIDGNDTSQPNFTPCVRTVHADECYQLRASKPKVCLLPSIFGSLNHSFSVSPFKWLDELRIELRETIDRKRKKCKIDKSIKYIVLVASPLASSVEGCW